MPDDPSLAKNNGTISIPTKDNTDSFSDVAGMSPSTEESEMPPYTDESEENNQTEVSGAVKLDDNKEHYGYRENTKHPDIFRCTLEIPEVFPIGPNGLPIGQVAAAKFDVLVGTVEDLLGVYEQRVEASKDVSLIKHACKTFLRQYKTAEDMPWRHKLIKGPTYYKLL